MNHIIPFVAIAGYVSYPKDFRINPSLLHVLSIIHNALLVGFSAWTFVSMSQVLYNEGFVFQSNYYFQNPQFERIAFWFYISKYYEFFDTFLLYLNGKTPIFLQKYHHIGAVLSWHFKYFYKVDAIWLTTLLNSFVHTIMYSYYLGCLLKINKVRLIRQYMTTMQLCQFFMLYLNCYIYRPPIETWRNYLVITFVGIYGAGLVYLFGKFYYVNYINKQNKIQ